MKCQDGKSRCSWVNLHNDLYVKYHDEEWGRPVHDDKKLFELFLLECFQAGLSWETILNKREAFRKDFADFDIDRVAEFTEKDVERLMNDKGIIRHRKKIEAAVSNARVLKKIQKEYGSLDAYLWHWTDGRVICETGLTTSALSDRVSRDLKKRGMKFMGSTTMYSTLQAMGIINSHDKNCYLCRQKS